MAFTDPMGANMKVDWLSLVTVLTTALSAVATFAIAYTMGIFDGFFEDASIGPLPLWVACLGLMALQLIVCFGTLGRAFAHWKRA